MGDGDLTPERIMQVGMGFMGTKTLLSAVELGLFTLLADAPLTGAELNRRLKLHDRANPDFYDALVAIGFLERDGNGPAGRYRNTPETGRFLDRNKPSYVGGILEMANERLYPFWADLTTGLRTGEPQNEVSHGGTNIFNELYKDPHKLHQFLNAMTGVSRGNFRALAEKYDFSRYQSLCDVGGCLGILCEEVSLKHKHLTCITADLPVVTELAGQRLRDLGLGDRVHAQCVDFFADPLPKADVICMGMILHDWDLPNKKMLIRKAYEALPPGGAFIAVEHLIDDARRENAFGLLMSLNMLIEFGSSFDFTGADFAGWAHEAGFQRCEVLHLNGPASAAIAYK